MTTDRIENSPSNIGEKQLALEELKIRLEHQARESDRQVRTEELNEKRRDEKRANLTSPIMLALVAAFIGLFSSSVVALINGYFQRILERDKAETQFVLDAITEDVEASKENLRLLAEAELLSHGIRQNVLAYLDRQKTGEGPRIERFLNDIKPSISAFGSGAQSNFADLLSTINSAEVNQKLIEGISSSDYGRQLIITTALGSAAGGWISFDALRAKSILQESIDKTTDPTLRSAFERALANHRD